MQVKKSLKSVILSTILLILLGLFLGFGPFLSLKNSNVVYAESESKSVSFGEYLSNLTPLSKQIGYGSLKLDENLSGETISFIVGSERKYFNKGLIAHATSTLVYDIGENHHFSYFSTYLGIDAVQNGKGNVIFSVFTSQNNETWETELEPTVKTSADEATFLKFSVENIRYIKFIFDSNGTNSYDHSGLGDCKLYTDGYDFDKEENLIKTVDYYNELFQGKTTQDILENYTLELMQRKFVDNVGYNNLKYEFLIGQEEPFRRTMLTWLYNDKTALKDFVTGGKPNGGNYINALKVLTRLYKAHSSDLFDTNTLFEPETGSTRNRGDVYRTMMIAIALTNAKDVYGWVNSGDILDPLKRYEAIKYTYLAETYHLRYNIFENLCVEEMRYLMSSRINSEEIYWLNAYATIKYGSATYPQVYSPHRHIRYGRDWNYAAKGYFEKENFEKYNQKYMLEEYGVEFSTSPRLWMAMEGSQICWGISYLGTNFASAFGVPSHYVRQPDHAAFFVYNKDANGRTIWSIDNDIFGWTKTWMNEDTVGHGNNRMMCDWGTNGDEQVKHSNGTYIFLSSTALDNQESYEKAELVMSLKSFNNQSQQEQLYRYALSIMPYHFDAWYELVKLYLNTNRNDNDLVSLAEEIAKEMYCFPLPMHELIGLIENELSARKTNSSLIQLANVRNIDNIALQKATNANNDENAKKLIAQTGPCIQEAKYLLGLVEEEKLASFSFDGEDKNKLVFNSKFVNVRYKYSLDGGTTWSDSFVTSSEDLTHQLTLGELNSITSSNDIYIWLDGWGTINLDKAFKIDILDGASVTGLEENDNENKFFGTFNNIEYSLDNLTWQDLQEESVFEGEQTVYVRNKRYGVTLEGETLVFTFTNNTNPLRNYISISNLELYDFSSEEAGRNDYAKHVIDGKMSTRWHTKWSGGDNERYITVKLDKNRCISGIDYSPVGGNGTMYACDVFVSVDGENWVLASSVTGWNNNTVKKSLTFTPVYGQYIKVVGTNTVGGFCSAKLLEFFEDTTLSNKQISKLELENLPKQEIYVVGQTINYNGLKAKIVFQDNTLAIIPNELLILESVTFSQVGTQMITVKYSETIKTTFEVKVIDKSDGVARVGTIYYSSLKSAISSIIDGDTTEETIELLKDVEVSEEFIITKKIIINGNNHILKRKSDYLSSIFTISGNGNLTLNNLKIDGGAIWEGDINDVLKHGAINSGIVATSPLIKTTNTSSLTLKNCTLQNNYNNYSSNAQNTGGAIFVSSNSRVTISNTKIIDCYSFLFGSAIYARDTASVTINSGIFSGNSGNKNKDTTVICIDNNATCIVNGGEFYNNLANTKGGVFWISNGRLEINGGKFINNYATNGSGIYLNGNAKVYIADFEEMGEVYLPNGKNIYLLGMLLGKTLTIKMENSSVDTLVAICEDEEIKYKVLKSLIVDNKLLYVDGNNIKIGDASNSKVKIKKGEREILFLSLNEAINSAEQGDVLTLVDNITLSEEIYIEKVLTINLSNFLFEGIENIKTQSLCKVTYSDNLIEVCDHIYNLNITYTWNDNNTSCMAKGYCSCGKEHIETVSTTHEITTCASYENEEITTFVAEFAYEKFTKQEKEVITGEKLIKPQEKNNLVLIASLCGGVVLVGLILFIIRRKKKKNKRNNF